MPCPYVPRWLSVVEATRVVQGVEWDDGRAEANSPSTNSGTAEPAGARPEGPIGPEGHAQKKKDIRHQKAIFAPSNG